MALVQIECKLFKLGCYYAANMAFSFLSQLDTLLMTYLCLEFENRENNSIYKNVETYIFLLVSLRADLCQLKSEIFTSEIA